MPSSGSPSLEPHETNCGIASPASHSRPAPFRPTAHTDLPEPVEQSRKSLPNPLSSGCCFRHRSWWHDRLRVLRALDELYPAKNRPLRFGQCGNHVHIEVSNHDPPEYRLAGEFCRDRWCKPCQRERGRIIAANIVEHLDGSFCRFLTLTIRTDGLTLRQAVQKLYTSFSRLRLTTFWRTRVTGGCATCEIKRTRDGLRWHPHLHLLVQGEYLPVGKLGQHWHEITGDSYICHIMACDDNTQAARYVTKYLSKPVPSKLLRNPEHLKEAILALDGRHLVATFGTWRGVKLTHTESQAAWARLCSFRDLVVRVIDGDRESTRILNHLMGQQNIDPSPLDSWLREQHTLHHDLQYFLYWK